MGGEITKLGVRNECLDDVLYASELDDLEHPVNLFLFCFCGEKITNAR